LLVQLGEGDAAVGDDRLAVVLLVVGLLIDHGQVGGGDLAGLLAFEGLRLGNGRVGVADVGHGSLLRPARSDAPRKAAPGRLTMMARRPAGSATWIPQGRSGRRRWKIGRASWREGGARGGGWG